MLNMEIDGMVNSHEVTLNMEIYHVVTLNMEIYHVVTLNMEMNNTV